ncbi:hypothetical protein E4U16_006600 [Claviceps sp. LM84 group G4]|nr:hypothetical protein E4U33_006696 [Claviceps sp. LM78 group G4]KAG6070797.1 hypothetical protein E4U16_006600 [Claviceps sp. LM84 group G4]
MDAKSGSLASSSQQATPGTAKDNVTKPKVSTLMLDDEIHILGPLWPSLDPVSQSLNFFSADVVLFTAMLRMQGRKIEARRVYAVFESGGPSVGL